MKNKKLGRYELIRILGKGAMGMVYEGRDPNLDRRVAIKTIKVENLSAEEAAEYEVRFRTEARSAARLQHPNIVSVYDSDRDVDIAYLVMEFVQGEDIKDHLDRGKVFALDETVRIMSDLLAALDYAHRQSIVHRDVKPANLMMEPGGRVKLTDFGVARIQDSGEATRTQGSMVGTLKYMSPEQVQGLSIDTRSDLYAAGIVLYQLLTGRRPFEGASDFEIIQQIVSKPHEPPSSISPHLPLAIDAVVARALEKSRDARFSTANEFSLALNEAMSQAQDRTVTPPPRNTPPGKSATWSRTLLASEALSGTSPSASSQSRSGTSAGSSTVTQEVELVYWKDIKESEDPEDFEEFLAKFPAGIYTDLARRRLKKLLIARGDGSSAGSLSGTRTLLVPMSDATMHATAIAPQDPAPSAIPVTGAGLDEPTMVVASPVTRDVPPEPEPAPNPDPDPDPDPDPVNEPVAEHLVKQVAEPVNDPVPRPVSPPPLEEKVPVDPARGSVLKWALPLAGVVLAVVVYLFTGKAPQEPTPVASPTAAEPTPAAAVSIAPSTVASSAKPAVSADKALAKSAPRDPKKQAASAAVQAAPGTAVISAKPVAHAADAQSAADKASHEAKANETAPASTDPTKACEGRWLLGFQICMNEQCAKSAFVNHPACVERRRQEENRKAIESQKR